MVTTKEELEEKVEAMVNSKLSVYKLAERTDVSKTHIHGIIKQTQKPSLEVLMKIARCFDVKYTFTNSSDIMQICRAERYILS